MVLASHPDFEKYDLSSLSFVLSGAAPLGGGLVKRVLAKFDEVAKKAGKKEDEKDSKEGNEWNAAMEGYENSLEVDHVFERFAKRVGYEGEQCIRYTLIPASTLQISDLFIF